MQLFVRTVACGQTLVVSPNHTRHSLIPLPPLAGGLGRGDASGGWGWRANVTNDGYQPCMAFQSYQVLIVFTDEHLSHALLSHIVSLGARAFGPHWAGMLDMAYGGRVEHPPLPYGCETDSLAT
jgi:hypothetical protein